MSVRWYFNDLRDRWTCPSYFELNNLLEKKQFRFLFFSYMFLCKLICADNGFLILRSFLGLENFFMCYNRINPNSFVVVLVHLVGIFGSFALSSFPHPEQTNKNYFFLEKSQLTKIAKSSAGEGVIIPMKSTGLKMIF